MFVEVLVQFRVHSSVQKVLLLRVLLIVEMLTLVLVLRLLLVEVLMQFHLLLLVII